MIERSPGNLFIVAAPSGGGKTSLVKQLIDTLDHIEVSVSHTTRAMRPGESEGVDYFFVSKTDFEAMVQQQLFVEHALVFEHYYGTSKAQIEARLAAGIDVVLDIDWQGAQQIKRAFPQAISVFVVPPSLAALKARLQGRGQDQEAVIAKRMQCAQDEMSHFAEFDYLIVNDVFNTAAAELVAIVQANRLSIARQQVAQAKLLSFLLANR